MSKALYILLIFCVTHQFAFAQPKESGIITANVFDSTKKALNGVSVQLISMKDSVTFKNTVTDKEGSFTITEIPFGYYRLRLSYVGMQTITLDSIFFRTERFDFNLND
ncbi:MAG TPA: carboxypeptidase-like regulatory domain-containing protein, partial [Chitinophagaceae bacterium]|nr:carboxypeptidase-like regulatory domain-containing protein [Chitinophagaceae bacterium]